MLYNAFQSARQPQSVLMRGVYTPCHTCPWTHQTQHPKLPLDQFSRFCTAHGRESIHFATCIALIKKIIAAINMTNIVL